MDLCKDPLVPPELAAKYEGEAGLYWDLFYLRNKTRFFRDRHYFGAEFPQLLTAQTALEVGCGVGNSAFPLLDLNLTCRLYACDFAPSAVALVRQHPLYAGYAAAGRLHAFVADITADDLTVHVPPGSVDVCTMIFVLSAVGPDAMSCALRSVARTLRPGGQLLFRDYAAGDLAESRLAGEGRQQRLSDSCYVRWDGTLAYYFTQDGLRRLFEAQGFSCDSSQELEILRENRKKGEQMDRRFIQAVFTYTGAPNIKGEASSSSGSGSNASGVAGVEAGGSSGSVGGCRGAGGADEQKAQGAAPQQQQRHQQQEQQQQLKQKQWKQQQQQEKKEDLEEVRLQLGGVPLQLWCRAAPVDSATAAAAAAHRAASECLAAAVLQCPALFTDADVLDLCSWDAPLGSLAALRWCRRAVAAGCSAHAARLLQRNALRNGHLFIIERLRVAQLSWELDHVQVEDGGTRQDGCLQQQQQQQQVRRAFPAGFHAVLAASPAAAGSAALQQLLSCAAALLGRQQSARLLLCAGDGEDARQAAAVAGLREVSLPAGLAAAAAAAVEEGMRLLCLKHAPRP